MTVSITTAGGTTSTTMNFSAADAQRILNAFQVTMDNPNATQQDICNNLATRARMYLTQMTVRAETNTPTPPDIS